MTPEGWRRVRAVFEEAAAVPREARAGFLREACGGDGELEREVASLLRAAEDAGDFLEGPAAGELRVDDTPPERVGPYEIVREIGHGGMGTVYLAVRSDAEFEKKVALKLVRRGMDTELILRRFKSERQILAGLDHPNIARLFDGGTTDGGRPYFVMEHIEGSDLLTYASEARLTVQERVRLFLQVCEAVRYAHAHLVVHRDIKPGNVLVTRDGAAKLLDFGLAKVLVPALDEGAATATAAARLLTPEYASPEQLRGEPITTASDVYSLGVVLYELLTGRRPHRVSSPLSSEIARVVCEEEPLKPSTAVGATPREETARLRRALSGDLDNVVLRALRKEPSERYVSVEQLAEDLRRFLDGRPVLARPATLRYRAGKFVRRNRAAVLAAGIALLALVTGLFAATWEARVARREKERADRRFADVRRLANSFLFEFHDAILYLPGSTAARALVVKRALQYLDGLAQESSGELDLERELAAAYQRVANVQAHIASASLGDTRGARRSYLKALDLRKRLAARTGSVEDQAALAQIHGQVSQLLDTLGDYAASVAEAREAVAIRERLVAKKPDAERRRDLAVSIHYLAGALGSAGDHDGALTAYRRERVLFDALLRSDERSARFRWGLTCAEQGEALELKAIGRAAAALDVLRDGFMELARLERDKPDHASVRRGWGELHQLAADCRRASGDAAGALDEERTALRFREAWCLRDPDDADGRRLLAETRCRLGRLLVESGAIDDGRKSLDQARQVLEVETARDALNVEPRCLLGETYLDLGLAESLGAKGRDEAACALFRKSRETLSPLRAEGRLPDDARPVWDEADRRATACGG